MSRQNRHDTDAIVIRITRAILKDLELETEFIGNPREWALRYTPLDSYEFKKMYQITNLLAKYTFSYEAKGASAYDQAAVDKFLNVQRRLYDHKYDAASLDVITNDVVMFAKGFIQEVLGEYDLEEHLSLCYFPKKSSRGSNLRNSTLCHKWEAGLTGSSYHCQWFTRVYKPWHSHCQKRKLMTPVEIEELQATLVAKRWNSRRLICPNTGIGGLYTNGLGRVIEDRLRRRGYDIKNLTEVHKKLACQASRTNALVTCDQSTASDNITVGLAERLLPIRWFRACVNGRIPRMRVGDNEIHMVTLSTMGIGYTFPLQTLIFLALAHGCLLHFEASGRVVKDRTISCFGDDLIFPKEIYELVGHVFERLGLVINHNKTFASGPFRESCGGDYHNGCDVRPAFLPAGGKLTRNEYLSFLYKCFNLLKLRWHMYEIRLTLETILEEIRSIRNKPHIVPPSFGDDSGLKLDLQEIEELGLDVPNRNIHGSYTFQSLAKKPNLKKVLDDEYYYWYSLQHTGSFYKLPSIHFLGSMDTSCLFDRLYSNYTPIIRLEVSSVQPKNYRSKLTGRKLKKHDSFVIQPGDNSPTVSTQSQVCVWI